MTITPVGLPGMYLIEPRWHGDERGRFGKVLAGAELAELGLEFELFDVNVGETAAAGTIRGLHHQIEPHAETKIFQCVSGGLFDVCVDVRAGSPTFGQWYGHELRPDTGALFIPPGLSHGYQTLEPDTRAMYFTSTPWAPDHERGVRWNDPRVGIEWSRQPADTITEKDQAWPDLEFPD